jgi:hypothetical protein
LKCEERAPTPTVEIFDVVRLIKYQIIELLAAEDRRVLHSQLIGGDHDVYS